MRRFAIAAMLIALVAAPAYAQRGPKTTRTDAQKQTDAEIDRAYQRALQSSGNKAPPAPVDPWGKVRPATGGSGKR